MKRDFNKEALFSERERRFGREQFNLLRFIRHALKVQDSEDRAYVLYTQQIVNKCSQIILPTGSTFNKGSVYPIHLLQMPTGKMLHFSSAAFHNHNYFSLPCVYFCFLFGLILDQSRHSLLKRTECP